MICYFVTLTRFGDTALCEHVNVFPDGFNWEGRLKLAVGNTIPWAWCPDWINSGNRRKLAHP